MRERSHCDTRPRLVQIYTTAPMEDPRDARTTFARLEAIGYDGAFSFEAKLDPFLPLVLAAEHTTRAAARHRGRDRLRAHSDEARESRARLQSISDGRFVLGLGSQVRPHVEKRFGMPWSRPVERMREMVQAIRAIFAAGKDMAPLDFRGEFYRHTLMIPAFDPGPNPFGPPPIFTGGFGPRMTAVAGEVADGFIAHPFNSRAFAARERAAGARTRAREERPAAATDLEVICATLVVTADDEDGFERSKLAARKQLAFYGSTPAYRSTLDCHGWDELHAELNRLSKTGRWDDMTALIDDEILETIAVVGPRATIADRLRARLAGIADGVSLTHNRAPDPAQWADVVAQWKRRPGI